MAVQDGTLRYNERYRKVQEGTSQYKNRFNCTSRYVLARTYPYCSIRLCFPAEFAAAILPGRQLCIRKFEANQFQFFQHYRDNEICSG